MEQLVTELKKILPLKDTTIAGDIVIIAAREPQMLVYALVEEIDRDQSRKEEWWHLTLHLLLVPPQTVVWTLRTPQFTGREIFTMGGEARFVQAVHFDRSIGGGKTAEPVVRKQGPPGPRNKGLRVIK